MHHAAAGLSDAFDLRLEEHERWYMQLISRHLTGVFRPLSVRQQSHRVPALFCWLSPRVAPSGPSTQTALLDRHHHLVAFSSAQPVHTPDQPLEADAEVSGLQDDLRALFRQDFKSTAKSSRPSTSPHVFDDSQHWIKASLLPAYAWPFLTKLRLAGIDMA